MSKPKIVIRDSTEDFGKFEMVIDGHTIREVKGYTYTNNVDEVPTLTVTVLAGELDIQVEDNS